MRINSLKIIIASALIIAAAACDAESGEIKTPAPQIKRLEADPTKGRADNPIRIIHVSLEFPGAQVGGVGSVAKALVKYQSRYGDVAHNRGQADKYMQASVVTPWYDIIKPKADDVKHVASVKHVFKGQVVQSDIFVRSNDGMTQYLVKPSNAYARIFDIGNAKHLFDSLPGNNYTERVAYFVGATTSFVSEFKDESGKASHFDIAHIHSMVPGLMPWIFSEVKAAKSSSAMLPHTVFQLHGIFDVHLGKLSAEECAYLGLKREDGVNAVAAAVKGADAVIAVSRWLVDAALKHRTLGPNLKQQKIVGILNGLDYEAFNPANLKGEAGEDLGFGPHDVSLGKKRIKRYLAAKGILNDPNRPLIVYVGRYSKEKGVEMLPEAAKYATSHGANVVLIGTYASSLEPFQMMEDLKKQNAHNRNLRVMLTLEEQEKGNLGKLIRAAADFAIVPSFSEGAGLVPREFMASGAMLITSGAEALAEQAQDLRKSSNPLTFGNAFVYGNNPSTRIEAMKSAIQDAISFTKVTSADDKNAISARIMKEAVSYDWSAQNGALDEMFSVYRNLLKRNPKQH